MEDLGGGSRPASAAASAATTLAPVEAGIMALFGVACLVSCTVVTCLCARRGLLRQAAATTVTTALPAASGCGGGLHRIVVSQPDGGYALGTRTRADKKMCAPHQHTAPAPPPRWEEA